MMTERRSGRVKKNINYSKLDGSDEDIDDDFEEFKIQPKKKPKLESIKKEETTKLSNKSSNNIGDKSMSIKPRLSLEEKVLQRQLMVVLEASKADLCNNIDKETENSNTVVSDVSSPETSKSEDDDDSSEEDDSSEIGSSDKIKERVEKVQKSSEEDNDDDFSVKDSKISNERKFSIIITETAKKSKNETNLEKDENLPTKASSNLKITPAINSNTTKITQSLKKDSLKKAAMKENKNDIPVRSNSPKLSIKVKETRKQKSVTNGNVIPILHTSPIKLSPTGIRLGLSRKISRKPLHTNVKPPL